MSSLYLNFLLTGSYVLQVQNRSNGFTLTKNIFVSGAPAAPTITGPSAVCAGSSVVYSASGTNAVSFIWRSTTGLRFAPDSLTNPVTVIFGSTPTTNSLRVRSVNRFGCISTERLQSVSSVSAPSGGIISGTSAPCISTTVSLSYSISGVTGSVSGYIWSATNLAVITGTGSTVQIRFTQPGSTTIRCVPQGTSCAGDTIVLVVNASDCSALLAVAGPTAACSDAQIGYKTNNPGTYTWSLSPSSAGTILSGQGTDSITVVYSADYAVSVTNVTVQASPVSGTPASRSTAVTSTPAFPNITAVPSAACAGVSVACTGSSLGATSYLWDALYVASKTPSTTSSFSFVMGSRTAQIRVRGRNGTCVSATRFLTVNLLTSGCSKLGDVDNSHLAPSISVYPNPAQNMVSLELNGREESVVSNVEIRDLTGAIVKRVDNMQLYLQQASALNVSDLAPGLYQISMTANGEVLPAVRLLIAR